MKQLFILSIISLSLAVCSCGSNNAAKESNIINAPGSPNATTSISTSDASFSCKLDGKVFSESGSTGNINAAFHVKDDDKKEQIFFMLADVNDPSQKLTFAIPDKTGATTIQNSPPHFSYEGLALKDFVTYTDDPVTVNVTSITPSRVTGTFSGKYTLENKGADSNAKQTIEVTDGKFDIPFSTDAGWKKFYHAE